MTEEELYEQEEKRLYLEHEQKTHYDKELKDAYDYEMAIEYIKYLESKNELQKREIDAFTR